MKNTVLSIEEVLQHLQIDYRVFPCREGWLFFCKLPEDNLTFDLQCSKDGTVHLWRFVSDTSNSKAGTRCEYRKPMEYHSAIGIEVTSDGETAFFVEKLVEDNDPDKEIHIKKIIKGYIALLSDSSIRNLGIRM